VLEFLDLILTLVVVVVSATFTVGYRLLMRLRSMERAAAEASAESSRILATQATQILALTQTVDSSVETNQRLLELIHELDKRVVRLEPRGD